MGEWGAEWQSQFSSEMSFAPGEERTLAEKQRSSVLDGFYAARHTNMSQNLQSVRYKKGNTSCK